MKNRLRRISPAWFSVTRTPRRSTHKRWSGRGRRQRPRACPWLLVVRTRRSSTAGRRRSSVAPKVHPVAQLTQDEPPRTVDGRVVGALIKVALLVVVVARVELGELPGDLKAHVVVHAAASSHR